MARRFVAQTEEQKLLNEQQFSEVFLEYLQILDDFDASIRNQMQRMKSIRYHVDHGIEEHPDLCKRLYREFEEQKQKKNLYNNEQKRKKA
ncbi:MAG: hypothetical protein HWE22_19775 [Flavobacteriales bacterium]|nr:hypothetical protein [Flavobacteriales bacterium]